MSSPSAAPPPDRFSDLSALPDANRDDRPEPDAPRQPFKSKHYDPAANTFDFGDLAPVETTVKWKGEEYVLTEASTDAATRYKNLAMKSAKMSDAKVIGVDGLADAEPLLVSLCLFRLNPKVTENGKPKREAVSLATFRAKFTWVIGKQLFEWVKYHSDLDEEPDLDALLKQRDELDKQIGREQLKRRVDPTGAGEPHPQGE
jgi:hypothetical protein